MDVVLCHLHAIFHALSISSSLYLPGNWDK